MATEHNIITDPELHEPKGVAAAGSGQVYVANGAGSGTWTTLGAGTVVGWFLYEDVTTTSTPIAFTGGGGYVYLTNDGAGSNSDATYAPVGVANVFNVSTDKFEFDDLQVGDMLDIRINCQVITTGSNQSFDIALEMETDGTSRDIVFIESLAKTAATHKISAYDGIVIRDAATLAQNARFKISSDTNGTIIVDDFYCKVLINR